MTHRVYEIPCGRCGNIFTSLVDSYGSLCSICYNAKEQERLSTPVTHSSNYGSGKVDAPTFFICGFIVSVVLFICGHSVPILGIIGLWGMKIFAIPVFLLFVATLLLTGLLTGGDFSALISLIKWWWGI